jgi:hypothetical protein
MKAARNIAIIVLIALALTFMPAGSNVATGLLTVLGLLIGVSIVGMLIGLWRRTGLQRDTLTDRQRWIVYGSCGAIALMVAGADEMLSTGTGTVAWVGILALSGWLIFNTWRSAQSI